MNFKKCNIFFETEFYYVAQASLTLTVWPGLPLTHNSPVSASQVLGLCLHHPAQKL